MFHERKSQFYENVSDSDGTLVFPESATDLFDNCSYFNNGDSRSETGLHEKLSKLSVVQLEPISIVSTAALPQHIVNLKQSFKFSASKQMSTQTSQINFAHRMIISSENVSSVFRRDVIRPSSLPPENVALTNLEKRVQADVQPKIEQIGDGDKIPFEKIDGVDCIPSSHVQCIMKPKYFLKILHH